MKLLKIQTLFLLYLFLNCFNKCVDCKRENEGESLPHNNNRDELEYLDKIDDSYFTEPLKDSSADDDIEGDNIFVRSPYLNAKYNSKANANKNGKGKSNKAKSKIIVTDKTTGFALSFILASIFISVLVIVAIVFKRYQIKKANKLKESPAPIVEAV